MNALAGKRIVLGVTGGIAAYKAIEVSRRLVDAGAHVVPIMTDAAQQFIGSTTLSALASEPVQTELWDNATTPIPHTKFGQTADLIVVAPATAKLLAAYRMGYSHDLLTNTLIATRAPVIVCPAMHTEMWEHPSVVDNIDTLRARGVHVVEPESGRLAGGDSGAGRLASPASILAAAERVLGPNDLAGATVVVSAGGTREPIDAVRVVANRSSGKQGYAVAEEAAARGATVTLISTVALPTPHGVTVVPVETAAEMQAAIEERSASSDVIVMAAAVADFRPSSAASGKIKKQDGVPEIVLEPTPDILAGLGANKPAGQVLVGFAAETNDLVANARSKLIRKNLDLIVANDVGADRVGFAHDTNAVTLLRPDAKPVEIDLAAKRDVARAVINTIVEIRASTQTGKD
ncbi:bifunctional phosphopantothenoylcysteine decarboxylase/phosphopantothenate--cysteine ligase CoaBC [Ilumatobacter nonamiensis]|uniref:bifunctional phosphopantothenoylcysteine decarboxylase/phosphopantothenate--cysteine ligase CoaBC n=1 Tax=Ilumatobacter nonamiensis TaxID=467093 RepID=UPI00034B083A|nr:bifunctional phosphopantothenoylcysteine decarboxylase/phosphopantothenate--cysteine ligase CoaBC [Ilumatobacter nonamiensis]